MIARVRARRDEGGFALVFVLFVTTVVMIAVAGVLTVVTPNIGNAKRGEDAAGALAAARSGVDDVIAYLVNIPSCRSESRICPAALGASSAALATAGKPRPSLGTGQSFSWSTASSPTAEGYLRVTSVGTANGTKRTLVADLSLAPSILAYGYYSDYESLSPQNLTELYYPGRRIYLTDSSIYGYVSARGSTSVPQTVTWNGSSTYANCGQHWYAEPGHPGRFTLNSQANYTEPGKLGSSTSVTRNGGCDLVFSSSMVQNGKTFTRDAILSSGAGPKFNQPVYTMWGYDDLEKQRYTNPAFNPVDQAYRGPTMTNTTNFPQVAPADLRLPSTIGTDGLPDNACVYTGPTRIKLNGDGTATVTSPSTKAKNPASDTACYPGSVAGGVIGWRVDYGSVGGGALVARNLNTAPAAGWPSNPTKSTQTPAATNEVFYLPVSGTATDMDTPSDSALAPYAGCSTATTYSATAAAPCAWTNTGTASDVGSGAGWSSYSAAACNPAPATTNRQLFECEYARNTSTTTSGSPAVSQSGGAYKTVRDAVQSGLANAACVAAGNPGSCVNTIVGNSVSAANSTSTTSGSHRYVATSTTGAPTTSTVFTGSIGSSIATDPFFTQPNPNKITVTQTPVTTVVRRQVYGSNGWSTGTAAFTLTTTLSHYTKTTARGASYFPDPADVTAYNTGTDSAGAVAGSTGVNQPGDVYVDGKNKGKLSIVADNDVVVTGDITNPVGYTADTDAVSIAAGQDVRNYHPVTCDDQDPTDIANTSPGWCPNDITGLNNGSLTGTVADPADRYVNMLPAGDRTIEAAVFALSGSLRTDNYNRGNAVGYLNIHGGVYQSFRGGNGVVSGSTPLSGTTLQYTYVDLQRAELPYVPPATSGNYSRPWNVVSLSAGKNPDPNQGS